MHVVNANIDNHISVAYFMHRDYKKFGNKTEIMTNTLRKIGEFKEYNVVNSTYSKLRHNLIENNE